MVDLGHRRHLDRDRKTIRAYLNGEREAGVRRSSVPDPLEPYRAYLGARFADNAHIWASALFDEVVVLGYPQSYVTVNRSGRSGGRHRAVLVAASVQFFGRLRSGSHGRSGAKHVAQRVGCQTVGRLEACCAGGWSA